MGRDVLEGIKHHEFKALRASRYARNKLLGIFFLCMSRFKHIFLKMLSAQCSDQSVGRSDQSVGRSDRRIGPAY